MTGSWGLHRRPAGSAPVQYTRGFADIGCEKVLARHLEAASPATACRGNGPIDPTSDHDGIAIRGHGHHPGHRTAPRASLVWLIVSIGLRMSPPKGLESAVQK